MYADSYDDYVSVDECAQRFGISIDRVKELVMARVLKASYDNGWVLARPAPTTAVGACG